MELYVLVVGELLRNGSFSSENLSTLAFRLVHLPDQYLVKLLILQTVIRVVSVQCLKNLLENIAIGNQNMAVPMVESLVAIRKSDDIPRSLVTLSTSHAWTLRTRVVSLSNLCHYLSNLKGP